MKGSQFRLTAASFALAAAGVVALPCGLAHAQDTKNFRIRNQSKENVRTLSDLYAFDGANNTGKRTEILRKGDATDDVNIAAGGVKNIAVPKDSMSYTVSWMKDGKEIEHDLNEPFITFAYATFDAPGFAGLMAVAFDDVQGALPPEGYMGLVMGGKYAEPQYQWFTFYDATASDGFIARDPNGVPISPLLSGYSVETAFHWSVIPAPSTLAVLGGLGMAAIRRRRR
ncbi:MAG: PEP-CTERM sorting domain-containing protein [Leptolyngbya sp. PLA2]|nr:PEP-CTERM sorting domain-containing protein [Leptolyngbya sp.]MCE7971342.1 PEP-CTERM sorting domain-containing protein [Leptolyngbya sp. PL-A2]MCQ3940559.1 hypothetical protein [cyanobacterium CYA1]MCZ7632445.1 PEP-CTERM sorting domain-containing protein [Phycisphaerales bacterium]MDL1903529.1 PEP-CTERM sorting domain-containing protein [Synechococcales cyanobacterium CNB]GIK20000.1 MAG: hypothetical protein BroJett004_21640 [Planctomycetota bacterium]